jgi:endosialidase-like protein
VAETLTPAPARDAVIQAPGALITRPWLRYLDELQRLVAQLAVAPPGGPYQPLDATLSGLAALTGTADTVPYFSGPDQMSLAGLTAYSRSLLVQATAGTWCSTLGLGTLSTLNSPLAIANGGTGATDAGTARTNLGLGTMAVQNASAVGITGGRATGLTSVAPSPALHVANSAGNDVTAFYSEVAAAGGTNRHNLFLQGDAPNVLVGDVLIGRTTPAANARLQISYQQGGKAGMSYHPDTDTPAGSGPCFFFNTSGGNVGSITCTGTTTAYNTTSDRRLKESITPLNGALAVIRALRPVSFRWQADASQGVGFLAHELMTVIPEAVTGEPDALNDDGTIRPQQVDHSRVIPWLTAAVQELAVQELAVQELAAQVQTLTARIATLEEALGV